MLLGLLEPTLWNTLTASGLALLGVAAYRRARDRVATRRDLTREQLARLRDQRDLQTAMAELLDRIEEATERFDARSEERLARLEAALREADARLGEPAARSADPARSAIPARAAQPSIRLAAAAGQSPAPSADSNRPAPPRVDESVARRLHAVREKHLGKSAAAPPAPRTGPVAGKVERVHALAELGRSALEIAEATNLRVGEIELILSLRRFRQQSVRSQPAAPAPQAVDEFTPGLAAPRAQMSVA